MHYVLIALLIFNGGPYQSNSRLPVTAEFADKASCDAAAHWIIEASDPSAKAVCLPRGVP